MRENREHVRHLSGVMKKICTFVMYAVPVSMVMIWTNYEAARSLGFFHRLPDEMAHHTAINYIGGFLISGLLALLAVSAVYHLRRFFALNSEDKIFSAESAISLHRFSKYTILYALLSIPVESALSLVMSFNNPVGERMISLSFQTYDFTVIFLSFVLFAISWVVKESVEVAEENAQFV